MSAAHTPGPWMLEGHWTLESPRLGGWISTTHPAPLFELIPLTGEKAEIIANARVAVTAPELLAACEKVIAAFNREHGIVPDRDDSWIYDTLGSAQAEAYFAARAAIAKAGAA